MKNPWISILTKPKETIKTIVDLNPNYRLFILSWIYGLSAFLGLAQQLRIGEKLSLISIFIPAIILAPIMGYILFSFCSWLVFLSGKWIKGKGTFKQIRAAVAWSNVPIIAVLLGWLILFIVFDKKILEDFTTKEILSTPYIITLLLVKFMQMIASIWSLVIYVNALASVQNFSVLKAIVNIIFSVLLMLAVLFLIGLAFSWPCATFFSEPVIALELF